MKIALDKVTLRKGDDTYVTCNSQNFSALGFIKGVVYVYTLVTRCELSAIKPQ